MPIPMSKIMALGWKQVDVNSLESYADCGSVFDASAYWVMGTEIGENGGGGGGINSFDHVSCTIQVREFQLSVGWFLITTAQGGRGVLGNIVSLIVRCIYSMVHSDAATRADKSEQYPILGNVANTYR